MWVGNSVTTAPGSMTVIRTSGSSSWRSDSDQPFMPHLVATGADLAFAERGFHGASTGYICERAGKTTGAFYSNWPTKLDLFVDVCKRHTDQVSADIAARLQRSSAGSLVEVFTEVFADSYDERWPALNIEFRLLCLRDSAAAAALAGYETDLVQRLGDQVENFLTAAQGRR